MVDGSFPSIAFCGASSANIYSHDELKSADCPISCNRTTWKLRFQHLTKYFHYLNHMQQGFSFHFLPYTVPNIFVRRSTKLQLFSLLHRIHVLEWMKLFVWWNDLYCCFKLKIIRGYATLKHKQYSSTHLQPVVH